MNPMRLSLADAVAPFRYRHRDLVDTSVKWSLSRSRWLPPDLVALALAASTEAEPRTGRHTPIDALPGTFWTRPGVNELLMHDVAAWCSTRGVLYPHSFPEAFWRFLDYLAESGQLHLDSDPIVELRRPLRCYGELGPTGRWEPDDVNDPGPCVCFVPYDGPTHGELLCCSE